MSERIPGTRAARRVGVKYPPPGPSQKRRKQWADNESGMREMIERAALALVSDGIKPTIEAVVDQIRADGGKLTVPTANRKVTALASARTAWEEKNGAQPEWHRKRLDRNRSEVARHEGVGTDEATGNGAGLAEDGAAAEAKRYKALYDRAKAELGKAVKSRDRIALELAEVKEQIRRLELAFTQSD